MKANGTFASSLVAPQEGEPIFDPYVVIYLTDDTSQPPDAAYPMTPHLKTDLEIDAIVDRMIVNLERVRAAAKAELAHAKSDTVRMALRNI